MIHNLDVLERDYIYPMVKTILDIAEQDNNQKALDVTQAVMTIIIQDREAHASSQ